MWAGLTGVAGKGCVGSGTELDDPTVPIPDSILPIPQPAPPHEGLSYSLRLTLAFPL